MSAEDFNTTCTKYWEHTAMRLQRDLEHTKCELERAKTEVKVKDVDMKTTMISLRKIQKAESKENRLLNNDLKLMKERLLKSERHRDDLNSSIEVLTKENAGLIFDIELLKNDLMISGRSPISHDPNEFQKRYELEKVLREKSEKREENERKERMNANARIVTIQTEFLQQIHDMQEKMHKEKVRLKSELNKTKEALDRFMESERKKNGTMLSPNVTDKLKDYDHPPSSPNSIPESMVSDFTLEIDQSSIGNLEFREEIAIVKGKLPEKFNTDHSAENDADEGDFMKRLPNNKNGDLLRNPKVIALVSAVQQIAKDIHDIETSKVNIVDSRGKSTLLSKLKHILKLGEAIGHITDLDPIPRRTNSLNETVEIEEIMKSNGGADHSQDEIPGHIKVFVRVKPLTEHESKFDDDTGIVASKSVISKADDNSLCISRIGNFGEVHGYIFNFDKVFGPESTEEKVFDAVGDYIMLALSGYNTSIFAYGETGSGKTHTMAGKAGTGPLRGILPRAIEQIVECMLDQEDKGWIFNIQVSFIEIFNENITDLLSNQELSNNLVLEVEEDMIGNPHIPGVTLLPIASQDYKNIQKIIDTVIQKQSILNTNTSLHDTSSQSNKVFTIHISASNNALGISVQSTLNLVDLAGSEYLDRSESGTSTTISGSDKRSDDSVSITNNSSLDCLVDALVAISDQQRDFAFHHSKLTRLVRPSLSTGGKILMIVTLSPEEESHFESLFSLRFASHISRGNHDNGNTAF